MRLLHFPILPSDDVGVAIATMRQPDPDYWEGHRFVTARRCLLLAST